MNSFTLTLSLLILTFSHSVNAQEVTLEAGVVHDFPDSASQLPTILQDLSFLEQSKIVFEEIIYNPNNIHHGTGKPSISSIKVAFYNDSDDLLFKANFDPSYLLARRLEDGSVGYYFEGAAFELENTDGEITQTYNGRFLEDTFRAPTLKLTTYVGLDYNVSGQTNITMHEFKGTLGQIVDIVTGSNSIITIFSMDYE